MADDVFDETDGSPRIVQDNRDPVGPMGQGIIDSLKAYHPSWWPQQPSSDPVADAGNGVLNLIGSKESRGNYDSIGTVGWKPQLPLPQGQKLSDMKIRDVLYWQQQLQNTLETAYVDPNAAQKANSFTHTAVGLLQFKPDTLSETAGKLGILDEPFSPDNQRKLGLALMNEKGFTDYLNGKKSDVDFTSELGPAVGHDSSQCCEPKSWRRESIDSVSGLDGYSSPSQAAL